jgi:hypothetical protein
MATNIDPALYPAPMGLDALAAEEAPQAIEIEIEDPESVRIGIDGLEIEIEPQEETAEDFDANLADYMDEGAMLELAGDLEGDIDNDRSSRKDWEKAYSEGLKLMGLQYEERTEPWEGACGVFHPMITEAVVRFQSETITETFPAAGPVKTKIIGRETPEKKEAAVRVEADMNYRLTEEMPEYRPEHEKMLWNLPAAGSAFKKVYFDPSLGRQVSMFIPAEDILLPYGTSDIQTCHRVTHVMRKTKNEILKLQQAGFYRDVDIGDPTKSIDDIRKAKDEETGFSDVNDERYTLFECHVDLNLKGFEDVDKDNDETGIALPYVVTLIKNTSIVLSIRRNWKEDDKLTLKRQHFVHYQYIPGFGAYGFGLFHLIGGFAKASTSLMRQLVDAGTLSNLPGGLKSRGLRIKGDDTPIAPGEFRDVDVGSGAIRDNIMPLPYKEPSATLFNLLNSIVDEGRRFAATADLQVSDMNANSPVGSTLAMLERQLKVMTAVQARVHYALKQELGLLAGIIRDYTPDEYTYEPDVGTAPAKQSDYEHVDIVPVSDPNAATLSQRVVQYQAVMQMAQMAPQIYDMPQLHRGMLDVLGIKNADKLVPLPDDQKPKDPVTENMEALKLAPLKAFRHQDHQAHIQVHNAMMQDPSIQQMIGQNPQAPQIMGAMMAHIAEHTGFQYRKQIEERLGMALPPEDEDLPQEVEVAISTMMAQAAQQVLQQNQMQAQQQQAQQQAQDPIVQMQQQELQIKQQEVQIKAQKLQMDAQVAMQKAQLEAQKESQRMQLEAQKEAQRMQLEERKLAITAAAQADKLEIEKEKIGHLQRADMIRTASQREQTGAKNNLEVAKMRAQARRDIEAAMNPKQPAKPQPK